MGVVGAAAIKEGGWLLCDGEEEGFDQSREAVVVAWAEGGGLGCWWLGRPATGWISPEERECAAWKGGAATGLAWVLRLWVEGEGN